MSSSLGYIKWCSSLVQVGQLQRQGENLMKPGALKSMGEVLEAMKDQNWRNLMDDRKLKVCLRVSNSQLTTDAFCLEGPNLDGTSSNDAEK